MFRMLDETILVAGQVSPADHRGGSGPGRHPCDQQLLADDEQLPRPACQ